jgi:hypothetical protein
MLMLHEPTFMAMTKRDAPTHIRGVFDFNTNDPSSACNMRRNAELTPKLEGTVLSVGNTVGIATVVDAVEAELLGAVVADLGMLFC